MNIGTSGQKLSFDLISSHSLFQANIFYVMSVLTYIQRVKKHEVNSCSYLPSVELIFKIIPLTDSAVHLQQSDDKDLTKSQTRRYITLWNLSVQKLIQLVNTVVKMSFWAVYAAHF